MDILLGALALIFTVCVTVAGFYLYLYPSVAAIKRKRKDVIPILFLNLIIGWTILGWGICLFWALNVEQGIKE